jgi:tetratricopeptide (TPR) repeat protein
MKKMPERRPSGGGADAAAAVALMQAGDYARAIDAFRHLAGRQPGLAVAHAGLGRCLGRSGQRVAALASLTHAGELLQRGLTRGMPADALLDVAFELQALHAHAASLGFIDAALDAAPALARAHHLKAIALQHGGRAHDALRCATRASALAPGEANALLLRATLEAQCGHLDAARAQLGALIDDRSPDIHVRAMRELGGVLDRCGQHDAAFDMLRNANAIQLAALRARGFDPARTMAAIEREPALCTAAWLQRHAGEHDDEHPAPVFLVGFYRCGTTLLEQMLASHPGLVTSSENPLIAQLERAIGTAPDPAAHWTERWAAAGPHTAKRLRALYFRHAEAMLGPLPAGARLLDKCTMNSMHAGFLRALFPDASIIFARRDPRDVLLSCFMQSFTPGALTAQLLDWQQAARFHDAVLRQWSCMRERLGDKVFETQYEELVRSPETTLRPLLAGLGLDWHDGVLRFHETAHLRPISTPSFADVTKPVHASASGRWQRHAARFDDIQPWIAPHIPPAGRPA